MFSFLHFRRMLHGIAWHRMGEGMIPLGIRSWVFLSASLLCYHIFYYHVGSGR